MERKLLISRTCFVEISPEGSFDARARNLLMQQDNRHQTTYVVQSMSVMHVVKEGAAIDAWAQEDIFQFRTPS